MAPPTDEATDPRDPTPDVTIHWRPGCGFCSSLLKGVEAAGLEYQTRNIWEDEEAADFVRSVAGGNETVPTVRVGDVALVNPTTRQLLQAVVEHAPAALPEDYEPAQPGRFAAAVTRLLGG
jgi:glutaredoxin-like protein